MDSTSEKSSENEQQLATRLFAEIKQAVQKRDFFLADSTRNKLLEMAPTALTEIIKAAELIDDAKSAAIDREHMATWDGLYSKLSLEEANCLFYSMKRVVVPPKRILLSQGAYNTRLFFIEKGKVVIVTNDKGKNAVLGRLAKGDLLGEYSFTSIALCSATAASETEVEMYCLENQATDSWDEEYPGLYEKIIDFCISHGNLDVISYRKDVERREKSRFPVTGPLRGVVLDKDGNKTDKAFRGALSDMSTGG